LWIPKKGRENKDNDYRDNLHIFSSFFGQFTYFL
jgi:hypothetical protein